jgi:hypothetical protein
MIFTQAEFDLLSKTINCLESLSKPPVNQINLLYKFREQAVVIKEKL